VIGNPINEVIRYYEEDIRSSTVHESLSVKPGEFFLVTMHRAENVDVESRLSQLVKGLVDVQQKYGYPVICSLHPHTRSRMEKFGLMVADSQVRFLPPMGYFDFVALERTAFCVLSDSGTVQEECCLFGIPNVTIRDVTERPETIESGSNMLSGAESESILRCVDTVLQQKDSWTPPAEYLDAHVSQKVVKIVLGYNHMAAR